MKKLEDKLVKWFERRNKAGKRTSVLDAINYLRRLEGKPKLTPPGRMRK
jgi:hypothetical protein